MKPDPTDPFERPATVHALPEPSRRGPLAAAGLLFGGATLLGAGVLLGHGLRPAPAPQVAIAPPPVAAQPPVVVTQPVQVDITPRIGEPRPRVEVAFVLDTTGSMGGLLKAAKEKVWSVVDALASEPSLRGPDGKPSIALSLVAFRDRGDDYVTKATPLTTDLDTFYQQLHALRAAGGGDAPEAVTEALEAAVDRLGWSPALDVCDLGKRGGLVHVDACDLQHQHGLSERTARVIFLVGDAPAHDFGSAARAVARARARGIAVSTIRCGEDEAARAHLTGLAGQGGGHALAIAQRPQVVAVQTPFDAAISAQQRRIEATVVAWGTQAQRDALAGQQSLNGSLGSEAWTSRASAQCKTGRTYDADLVQAVEDGRVKAAEVKAEDLADPQQRLKVWGSVACLVEGLRKERQAAQVELVRLVRERDAWLAENRPAAEGSFDAQVLKCLRMHLARAGIHRQGC